MERMALTWTDAPAGSVSTDPMAAGSRMFGGR